jgi:Uncharacterized conserved protein (DUF2203)
MAMNHKHKSSRSKRKVIRVWTHPEAKRALPYIGSVMNSLREHWLETKKHEAQSRRLERQPGRPERSALLAQEKAGRESREAKQRFNEAYEELQKIEVYCIDPNQGMGVVPFVHQDKLAWLIYDLFDPGEFHHWRYHEDPLDTRRPIAEVTAAPEPNSMNI